MYFSKFSYQFYPFGSDGYILMTDILKRSILRTDLIKDSTNFYNYYVTTEDTLEKIADKVYGNPYYYYVILMLNEIFDPRFEFPLEETAFEEFIKEKYGSVENSQNMNNSTENSSYVLTGDLMEVTTPEDHNLLSDRRMYLNFDDQFNGNAGVYTITKTGSDTFTVTIPYPESISETGNVIVTAPYLHYYIKNHEDDTDFYSSDRLTYNSTAGDGLKDLKSAYDIEYILNENKRNIKLLKPELLYEFEIILTETLK